MVAVGCALAEEDPPAARLAEALGATGRAPEAGERQDDAEDDGAENGRQVGVKHRLGLCRAPDEASNGGGLSDR